MNARPASTFTEARDPRTPITYDHLVNAISRSPFTVAMNVEVLACNDGYVELKVPIAPFMLQDKGFVHGAVIGFVADSACCWAAATHIGDVVTSDYKINFMIPGRGDYLIGKGYLVKAGLNQAVARADIYAIRNRRESLIATALATVAAF